MLFSTHFEFYFLKFMTSVMVNDWTVINKTVTKIDNFMISVHFMYLGEAEALSLVLNNTKQTECSTFRCQIHVTRNAHGTIVSFQGQQ